MTTRKTDINIPLSGKRKKRKEINLQQFTVPVPQTQHTLLTIPSIQKLSNIQGINPYLTPDLIPDLVWLYDKDGEKALLEAIKLSNPEDPSSIIFNHPRQHIHKQTEKVEIDMILDEPETIEREDIQCNCGSKRVQTRGPIQTRGGDEPGTIFAKCVKCKKRWHFSTA